MKKLVIMVVAAMAMATSYAMPTWALLDTKGALGENEATTGYSAYLCTKDAAANLFGGASDYNTITAYLTEYYVDFSQGITGMDKMDVYGDGFDAGIYSFSKYFQEGSLGDDSYIAIVAYLGESGNQFRVFESAVSGGTIYFDPDAGEGQTTGMAGDWTVAAIPEPTSGLLMLFGLAGLALKRRKA